MDDIQAHVQKAVHESVEKLDKECLRKMQAEMHRCSVRCCDDSSTSLERAQQCLEDCSTPINKAQAYVQKELQMFQDRLQRCALDCQDKVRDKMTANTSDAEAAKYRTELESCVVKCGHSNSDLLPGMVNRIKTAVKKGHYN